jgi:hypothetical protein
MSDIWQPGLTWMRRMSEEEDPHYWLDIAFWLSAFTSLFFVTCLFMSGRMIVFEERLESGRTLTCRSSCALRVLPPLIFDIKKAFLKARTAVGRRLKLKAARETAVGVVAFRNCFANLMLDCRSDWSGMRCCCSNDTGDSLSAIVHDLVDEPLQKLEAELIVLQQSHGAQSEAVIRTQDLVGTIIEARDGIIKGIAEYLAEERGSRWFYTMNVPKLVTTILLSTLRAPRLGTTIRMQVVANMGWLEGGLLSLTRLDAAIPGVWATLQERFFQEGENNQIASILTRLINTLLDERALRPINTVWRKAVILFGAWWVAVLGTSMAFSVILNNSRRLRQYVELRDGIFFYAFMCIMMVVLVLAQIGLTHFFLKRQAETTKRKLLEAVERTASGVLDDTEVLALIRSVVDVTVEATIKEVVGGVTIAQGPLQAAYSNWGGTDAVMQLIAEKNVEEVRPAIRATFDTALKRNLPAAKSAGDVTPTVEVGGAAPSDATQNV